MLGGAYRGLEVLLAERVTVCIKTREAVLYSGPAIEASGMLRYEIANGSGAGDGD